MRCVSFLVICLSAILLAQSPHGPNLQVDCSQCHQSSNWNVNQNSIQFKHSTTTFPLTGQHAKVACRQCHSTLIFNQAQTECRTCHRDVHNNTVGLECARCHTTQSWTVSNPNLLHQSSRFPLQGVHAKADCKSCHSDYSILNFKVLGVSCFDCHEQNFITAKNPDHVKGNYSKDCQQCHSATSTAWRTQKFNHDFFPLTGGHNIQGGDCYACHTQSTWSGLSSQCVSCHRKEYDKSTNPGHTALKLSTDCKTCHTINVWQPGTFSHNSTAYPLTGAHIKATCISCHVGGVAKPASQCIDCHRAAYDQSSKPKHSTAGFGTDCKSCHTTVIWTGATLDHDGPFFPIYSGKHKGTWTLCTDCHQNVSNYKQFVCITCHDHAKPKTDQEHNGISGYVYGDAECLACHPRGVSSGSFNHQTSRFPLTGKHITTDCAQCHAGGYAAVPAVDCKSCHQTEFANSKNPNHALASFTQPCEQCHNTSVWAPSTYQHPAAFPLTNGHANMLCTKCHETQYANSPKLCVGCHQKDIATSVILNHKAPGFSTKCEDCHTTVKWKPANFDHNATQYPLTGKHITVACNLCHATQVTGLTKICKDCHQANLTPASNPDHALANFTQPCEQCHNTADWKQTTYNHSITGYPLLGKHTAVTCVKCHQTAYKGVSNQCNGCHMPDYNKAVNPNHVVPQFVTTCESCHTVNAWTGVTYTAHSVYFPIYTGKHIPSSWANNCATCHTNPLNYKTNSCIVCHEHSKTTSDSQHRGVSGYTYVSTECYRCHPKGKSDGSFNHSTSNFPLTGAHTNLNCEKCHVNQSALSTACVACHVQNYNNTESPHHASLGISTDCKTCHTTTKWVPALFDHNATQFPLTGKHLTTECVACHTGNITNAPKTCIGCHQVAFNNSQNPNHAAVGISTDCQKCHTTSVWTPSTFNHTATNFPLSGVHITTTCIKCHNGVTTGTVATCIGCHQTNFNNSVNPNHAAVGISTDCKSCHNASVWAPSTFSHNATNFPLVGAHITTTCVQCHNRVTTGTVSTCIGCHQADFNNSTNPSHTVLGISTDCKACHTSTAWVPSTFNHSNTAFALTGAHITTQCQKCHAGVTTGTVKTCVGCHQANFNRTINPNHVTLALSTDCLLCHTTVAGWKPALFPNHATYFAFQGAHVAIAANCVTCHHGTYSPILSTCISCHQAKYTASTNPPHSISTVNFGTTCTQCHNQNNWTTYTWTHSMYGLNTRHNAMLCNQCHTTQSNYAACNCVSCHTSQYQSAHHSSGHANCYQCHSSTRWGGSPVVRPGARIE